MQIAKSIGLSKLKDEREIIFTSGGTESINWVLHSHSHNTGPSHFITTGLEHCAVNNYITNISSKQFSYSIVQGSTHRLVCAPVGANWCDIFRFLFVLVRCQSSPNRFWCVDLCNSQSTKEYFSYKPR